eukprot:gene36644-59787_t
MITAETAAAWGLVNKTVPQADLLTESIQLADKICRNSPAAISFAIESVNAGFDKKQNGFQAEVQAFGKAFGTADFKEGTGAFLDKRKPGQYSGRVAGLKTADGLLAGITSYTAEDCNPRFHSHENPHLILLLNGGNVYNSRRQSSEKMAGDVLFYHSDEVHQTLPGTVFSKCINLE